MVSIIRIFDLNDTSYYSYEVFLMYYGILIHWLVVECLSMCRIEGEGMDEVEEDSSSVGLEGIIWCMHTRT